MKRHSASFVVWLMCLAGIILLAGACSPPKPEPVKTVSIPDGEYDPAVWGKAYPLEYDSWLKSKDPNPPGLSKYRKGWTGGDKFDKLSEYPFYGPPVQRLGVRGGVQRNPGPLLHAHRSVGDRPLPPQGRRRLPHLQDPLCSQDDARRWGSTTSKTHTWTCTPRSRPSSSAWG